MTKVSHTESTSRAEAPKPTPAPATGKAFSGWSWQIKLWKSRLPIIALPILSSLQKLSKARKVGGPGHGGLAAPGAIGGLSWEASYAVEAGVLFVLAGGTGFFRLPFSVTWWLILMAACALETDLILGVATVLSLSVLVGWYGVRLMQPHAVMALWGGSRRSSAAPQTNLFWVLWQAWDLVVHLLPGGLMLCWYGPSVKDGFATTPAAGAAVATALPLNALWLWALGLGLPVRPGGHWMERRRLWPRGMRLSETNAVYNVEPPLTDEAWTWIFGSHVLVCITWAACLVLPRGALIAYGIFVGHGLLWAPFTNAWWMAFLVSMCCDGVGPLFRGITACCGATTAIGWYGTQILIPYALKALIGVWVFDPVDRLAPAWLSSRTSPWRNSSAVIHFARVADLFVHFFPTMATIWLFRSDISSGAALAAVPCNLLYLAATRSTCLADTNRIYQVSPQPPNYVWKFIYGSHLLFCSSVFMVCYARELLAAQAIGPVV